MALTSKLLEVLVKNNILKLSKLLKSQMWGTHCFFFRLSKSKKSRVKEVLPVPHAFLPSERRTGPPIEAAFTILRSCIPSLTQVS